MRLFACRRSCAQSTSKAGRQRRDSDTYSHVPEDCQELSRAQGASADPPAGGAHGHRPNPIDRHVQHGNGGVLIEGHCLVGQLQHGGVLSNPGVSVFWRDPLAGVDEGGRVKPLRRVHLRAVPMQYSTVLYVCTYRKEDQCMLGGNVMRRPCACGFPAPSACTVLATTCTAAFPPSQNTQTYISDGRKCC